MGSQMDSTRIESYVKQVQKLAEKTAQNPQSREELFSLIEGHRQEANGNRPFEEFFKGEAAFFNGHYDRSLKHYIQATSVPNFQFFCYRASAFVSADRQDHEKTKSFLEKAFLIYPEDSSLRNLKQKMENISTQKTPEPNTQFLSQIFDEKPTSKELFSEELPSPSYIPPQRNTTTAPMRDMESPKAQTALLDSEPDNCCTFTNPKSILKDLESTSTDPLKNTIRKFQLSQKTLTESYLKSNTYSDMDDFQLEVLHGWNPSLSRGDEASLLTRHSRVSSGGYYIRWNGKGIVLNPGKHFMRYFHENNHHIREIDYVIVSRHSSDAYEDIKEIYELNQELNKSTPELQIIHYYLNSETFQELSNYLKPSFKQARNTVHCLELFYDSPDVEKIEISEGIQLNYFPTHATSQSFQTRKSENLSKKTPSNLGLRLDLTHRNGTMNENRKIGYLGGCAWSPLLAHLMGSCDLLLLGFGHTQPSDYEKLSYNNDSLGLYGSLTLFQEILPRLLICTEFDGLEGDVRFEAVKQIREEHSLSQNSRMKPSHVVPGDIGMKLDLSALQLLCSITKNKILPEQLHVAKSMDRFGRLKFLSKECTL